MSIPGSILPTKWAGYTVAILASGESNTDRLCKLARRQCDVVVAVNNSHMGSRGSLDMIVSHDAHWWEQNHEEVFWIHRGAECWCSQPVPEVAVTTLKATGDEGYDEDPHNVRTGGHSGYLAMHIAAKAGARKIVLIGMDMQGKHWHPDHKEPLTNPTPAHFAIWIKRTNWLIQHLNSMGIQVVSWTPTALTVPRETPA